MGEALLSVNGLDAVFQIGKRKYPVLQKLTFEVNKKETVCMVGESGCGKSVTALTLMDLLPNNGKVVGGSVRLAGEEITGLSHQERRALRGKQMGMVFQEPMTALNPILTIGRQLTEGLRLHRGMDQKTASGYAAQCLDKVGIADPEERMRQYPFQMSGGMRQRVMIAMVLAVEPKLFIADEPTTALDLTIQKQIMELLKSLRRSRNLSIIFISHDIDLVADIADRIIVMYGGLVMESGSSAAITESPLHPYTKALLASSPRFGSHYTEGPLVSIPGKTTDPTQYTTGCPFAPRCTQARAECGAAIPSLAVDGDREIRCRKDKV